jgi:hypothetical protein
MSSVLPGFLGDVMNCKERGWVSAFQVRCRGCGEFLLLLLFRSHDEQVSLLTQQQPVAEYRVILGAVEALRHGLDKGLQRRVHGYIEQLAQRLRARMEMAHLDLAEALHRDEVLEQVGRQRRAVRWIGVEIAGAHDEVGRVGRLQEQTSPRP